ncbi:MAG: ATP-dependent sacrificial sulfur transferase LarE [Oscillospiraceae bacterium]|jgi:uncharacterized protein|nr:ATP-dependent sacrificial sulfur transferase LarE [Oscillospiraceae bacterium]
MTTELRQFFQKHPKVALAFSGGSDSGYLLHTAVTCGAKVQPYYAKSAFQPYAELYDAEAFARALGLTLRVCQVDILRAPHVAFNPPDRCYWCKRALFSAIVRQASADGYLTVIDGTNASDSVDERPGIRALRELEILSPLRLAGISKDEIRILSRAAGLKTWNKPPHRCLTTHVVPGEQLTEQLLMAVTNSERSLEALGFQYFRLRCSSSGITIRVSPSQLELVLQKREQLLQALQQYFKTVTLDLEVC